MIPTSNAAINSAFFAKSSAYVQRDILGCIARHYGITPEEALAEVTHAEAEHLLDYLTGSVRAAAAVLMKGHGLA